MSNFGQAVAGVAGAFIGFLVGGPAGVWQGLSYGLMIGSALFPVGLNTPRQVGPRLTDLQTTETQLGNPVAITYGTFAVPGQVMALGCVSEVETEESQTTVFSYFQTIAVGLCEGEICGVQRIWENGELKFDTRAQQLDETADAYAARVEMSGQYSLGFTLYLGSEIQEPDPDLELVFGTGLVPGFRGLAYIVFPERELLLDQAFRHPQWRFEVFRGVGERGVTSPSLITGALTSFDRSILMPDWVRNRFFCFDDVGTGAATGIRAFALRSNTEVLQRTFTDIGIGEPIAIYQPHVGVDGFIYMVTTFDNQGPALLYRIDPVTLDIVATGSAPLSQNQWIMATSVRVFAFGQVRDFLITVSFLGNYFNVWQADTLVFQSFYADGREEGSVCPGPVSGSHSYAYGLSYDEGLSGTNNGIDVLKFDCSLRLTISPITGLPVIGPWVVITLVGRIPHTDLSPGWVRLVELAGLIFDTEDDTLIFSARGATTTGISPIENIVVKLNPETLEVVWSVADTMSVAPVYDFNHNLGRLGGGLYVQGAPFSQLTVVDTGTGAQSQQDWSGLLPGNETFTGEEIYDGVTNCLLTYIEDVGPVLICLSVCSAEDVTLGEIVADVCDRSGVPVGGYDVSELIQTVHGYGVMRNMPGRAAIEALRPVGAFDAVESGTVIRFPVRGAGAVKTYTVEELSAHLAGGEVPPAVTTDKTQAVELPRIVRIHYLAPSREYEPGEQLSPSRFSPEVENEVDVEVPVALDDSQAAQIAEIVHSDVWAGRWRHEVSVDVSQLAIEPTDVVLVPVDGRLYRCRVAKVADQFGGLLRALSLVRDDVGSYSSTAVAGPPLVVVPGVIIESQTALVLLDLPPLVEADDNAGFYAAVHRAQAGFHWGGAVISRSIDGGASWAVVAAGTEEATVGGLVEALGPGYQSHTSWDTENSLLVSLDSGEFVAASEAAVIAGANRVAVGSHGRWEIVQFRDVLAIGASTFRLSHLLRGRRGTEVHIGSSVAGDTVVLLSDGALVRMPLQTSDIGQEYLYRAVTVGLSIAGVESQPFTGAGQSLEAWAPVRIQGVRDVGNDLTISFSRRSRFGSDLTPAWQNLPLTESPEAYEIDILGNSPGDVLRTISTSTESAVYTEAQQITDFGDAQALVAVRVYQMSTIVGRGLAGEATI
jgi:hypothetical protein